MTAEYTSPPIINEVTLEPSSLESMLLVSSIQSAVLLFFSLYPSPSGKWSGGFPKRSEDVCKWLGRSEEGKGQRHGNRGVGGIYKGAVSTLFTDFLFIVGLGRWLPRL